MEFRPGRSDASPGRELLAALNALLDAQYPGRAARPGSVTTPEEMAPPRGRFLVGYAGGRAVAIGGVRPLGPEGTDVAEIKRMYVVPEARSQGVGRALLAALEDAARELGYARVRLDAGAEQRHSRRLFADAGYRPIPPYNTNHIAVFFGEKDLAAPSPSLGPADDVRGPHARQCWQVPPSV
ncbi:GNAT family N-acetyltransferase [Actinomycetospora straminea]|uniref:N-acetyltransferase domain-containing protein n=1 Tax=Actinomycetospora straminea TaxID=663607 RepID=A0ABP9F826_9PSEU|nr:GNAT family N-acetyltransferase [Actinomycetospora straminea]MDD7936679.1 GNAT family N-acetyltransferase [Actinomycetospora straminea]